jgi:hypothetical protein
VVVDLLDVADAGDVDAHRALRLRMRPKEKITSSAVKGVPSWNLTPLRSSKRTCVGAEIGPLGGQRRLDLVLAL